MRQQRVQPHIELKSGLKEVCLLLMSEYQRDISIPAR